MSQAENLGDPLMGDGESTSSGTFTLQVVSPSVGVSGPLSLPQLPSGTTVKQLKEKIRESLPMQPSDDHQRLIHRGRLLANEDETMSEIFGPETLKASGSQTLHLVLKPSTLESTPAQNTANLQPQQGPPPTRHFILPPPQLPESFRQRIVNLPANTGPAQEIRIPTPPHFHAPPLPQPIRFPNEQAGLNNQGHPHQHNPQVAQTIQLLQQLQQDHARLHQEYLNQQHQQHPFPGMPGIPPHQNPVQPPAVMPSFQHLIAQHQRDRAALGMHGVQQHGAQQGSNAIPNTGRPGHAQIQANRVMHIPQPIRTSTYDMAGPNGERRTVTVSETTTFYPNPNGAPLQARTTPEASSLRDVQDIVQNIIRTVDGNANAQHTIPHQRETNSSTNPYSSTASRPASAPPPDTSTSTPLPTNSVRASSERSVPTTDGSSNTPTLSGPVVYILSSPTGPRALLVSPSASGLEAFYNPRRQAHWDTAHQAQQAPNHVQAQNNAALGLPEVRNRRHGQHGHVNHHGHRHPEAMARAAPGVAHPANPPAGAVAAQMWPHIWLIVRLLGFVLFFTSGSKSWWRLFMFSAVAFVIFIASTGVLNGIIEQVWGPIRRHLETLLPLAGPNVPQAIPPNQPVAPPVPGAAAPVQGQAGGVAGGTPGAAAAPPDPAQTAARLLEQRRVANGNWIWTQFRRLEHATILFVASLVPGVGERHIAARVAEENLLLEAQRQRREAEAAAAEEAVRSAEGGQENSGNAPTMGTDTDTTNVEEGSAPVRGRSENGTGGGSTGARDAPAQPLIEV